MAKLSFERISIILALAQLIMSMVNDLKTKETTTEVGHNPLHLADFNLSSVPSSGDSITTNREFLELDAALTIAFALEELLSNLLLPVSET